MFAPPQFLERLNKHYEISFLYKCTIHTIRPGRPYFIWLQSWTTSIFVYPLRVTYDFLVSKTIFYPAILKDSSDWPSIKQLHYRLKPELRIARSHSCFNEDIGRAQHTRPRLKHCFVILLPKHEGKQARLRMKTKDENLLETWYRDCLALACSFDDGVDHFICCLFGR